MTNRFKDFLAPFLVILLVAVVAFLVGVFWTKTSPKKESPSFSPPRVFSLPSEKFAEALEGAVLISGDPESKVKLVDFSDFQCPFCARFSLETLPQIEKEYVVTGKLAYYLRHFPLRSIHKNAENAALAFECAREQEKGREMHDMIFENQDSITPSDLKNYAQRLGLNTSQFNSCLETQKYKANIDRDVKLGEELGVTGTPTFFLNGRLISGAQAYSVFKAVIEEELKK